MYIHQQVPSNGGTFGGPPTHVQILQMVYGVQCQRAEIGLVVASDGGVCLTEGYARIYFGRRMGEEAT